MKRIAFSENWLDCIQLINKLIEAGYLISLSANEKQNEEVDLAVVRISNSDVVDCFRKISVAWLAWGNASASIISQAYQAGALAVFPAESDASVLFGFIERYFENIPVTVPATVLPSGAIQRRYQRGDIILIEPDSVLEVQQGIIAQTMIHQDGAEVLLGLFGPSNLVIPHPVDTCFIQLVAQTNATIRIRSWQSASQDHDFSDRLRCRLQQMEAWAAMQARPHLDQRILGILSLLAEQFGESNENGELINVRLTHNQLASAVGATRATITRTLSNLKTQGRILIITTPDGERICLPKWERVDHGMHHRF